MPRVSQEHLDARRNQILDAARRAFVRNGFHATSMQDIFKEAGLSAGATYRYFGSKEEIVVAIAHGILGQLRVALDSVLDADDPPPLDEAFLLLAQVFERLDRRYQAARLIIQVWAEAARNPGVQDALQTMVKGTRSRMADLMRIYQERGEVGPGDPEIIAKAAFSFFPGFILQHTIIGDIDAKKFAKGLRALIARGKVATE